MEFIEEEQRIYAEDSNGAIIAEVTFSAISQNIISLNHTFVDNSLRGQGIAGMLMEKACSHAVKHGKKIKPVCSYAVRWFEKHLEYADICTS